MGTETMKAEYYCENCRCEPGTDENTNCVSCGEYLG